MPETPKKRPVSAESDEVKSDTATWEEDQKCHEYYYDDAHGYEVYEPDEDEKEEAD